MHGLLGVGDEIRHHLVQHVGVGPNLREPIGQIPDDLDMIRPQQIRKEFDSLPSNLVKLNPLPLRRVLVSKGEEVLDDAGTTICRLVESAGPLRDGALRTRAEEQLRLAKDDGEGIIQLMRYPGQQRPHGR